MTLKKKEQPKPKTHRGPIAKTRNYINGEKQRFESVKSYFASEDESDTRQKAQDVRNDQLLHTLLKVGIAFVVLVVLYIILLKP